MLLCRCPCVEGICLEAHECPDSHKYPAPNNECLLRTMLLDARVPTKEHRFNFSIVKNYRGRDVPCVPGPGPGPGPWAWAWAWLPPPSRV